MSESRTCENGIAGCQGFCADCKADTRRERVQNSSRPCGCDPGANHKCEWHAKLDTSLEEAKTRMASREAIGKTFVAAPAAGNGEQAGFATGATRSTDIDKIDFEGHINPEVQAIYGAYMHRHRVQRDGKVRASDNWQQGIPVYRYVKSLVRHVFEFWRMWRGRTVVNPDNGKNFTFVDVLCAIKFNVDGILYELSHQNTVWLLDREYMVPADRVEFEQADARKEDQ